MKYFGKQIRRTGRGRHAHGSQGRRKYRPAPERGFCHTGRGRGQGINDPVNEDFAGSCPICEKHCDLAASLCERGMAFAREQAGERKVT